MDNLKCDRVNHNQEVVGRVRFVAREGLAGIVCFAIGGTFLMFVLHFMVKDVYVADMMDWVGFFGWMSLFSFVGFLLVGFGLRLIIKSTKS